MTSLEAAYRELWGAITDVTGGVMTLRGGPKWTPAGHELQVIVGVTHADLWISAESVRAGVCSVPERDSNADSVGA